MARAWRFAILPRRLSSSLRKTFAPASEQKEEKKAGVLNTRPAPSLGRVGSVPLQQAAARRYRDQPCMP